MNNFFSKFTKSSLCENVLIVLVSWNVCLYEYQLKNNGKFFQ